MLLSILKYISLIFGEKLHKIKEQGSKEPHNDAKPHIEEKIFSDEELFALIDPILKMDDTSGDGFIDYPEFIRAQEKAAAQQGKKPRT